VTDPPGSSVPVRRTPPRLPVEIVVQDAAAELVADRLFALGASAVSERPGVDRSVVLVADVDPATVLDARGDVLAGFEGVLGARILDQDPSWDTAWHDSARAWRCGERLLVRPHWVPSSSPSPPSSPSSSRSTSSPPPEVRFGASERIEVVLDPGPAFGAGSHPSTRACLAALEPLAPAATRVLDVGCGTGVLGIAALLLGAAGLTAIDIDPAAVTATTSALVLNGVAGRALVDTTSLGSVEGTFDLVLANLLLPIIEELGPDLAARVAPGGSLVLGGLLEDQLERAVAALTPLSPDRVDRDDGWVAAVLTAGPRARAPGRNGHG